MEEKPLYGGLTVYRERGAYLRRLEQFDKAKLAYDEAYKFKPDDVRLLIGRSQVCSAAVEPEQAFADAALALELEPNNMVAKNTQAQAMYTMSAFEQSLVMNHRGSWIRKQPPYFKEGVIQGLETMQDCIGTKAGDVMLDFLPIIRRTMRLTYGTDIEPTKREHVSRIPKVEVTKNITQSQARRQKKLSRVMAMKYLGPMANDKFFLESLKEDPRLKSANVSGSASLKKIVDQGFEKLKNHQETLRSQRPYYTIKRGEKTESTRMTKHKEEMLKEERRIGTKYVEKALVEIQKCFLEQRIMDLVFKAERLQMFLDNKTSKSLPKINLFLNQLYITIGKAYLSQYRVSYNLSEQINKRRVHFLLGLPVGRQKHYDSVIANCPYKITDIFIQIRNRLQQLEACENSYMKCWLYFELSRLESAQKNFMKANFYAQKCTLLADELDSAIWWLNGCFCFMSSAIQRGNIHEFTLHIQDAYEWSKKLSPETQADLHGFLLKCKEEASTYVIGGENVSRVKREKDILSIMDEQTRAEASVLFRRISALPPGRQFSVLPKYQDTMNMEAERRRRYQRGLTVVPGKEKPLRLPPKTKVPGLQIFSF